MHLALDQSPRRIGWALGAPDVTPETGVAALPKAEDRHVLFMKAAQVWLAGMIKRHHVSCVCCESVFYGRDAVGYAKGAKLVGAIELVCDDLGIRCFEVEADTWRGRFIGFKRAPRALTPHKRRQYLKDAAMRACVERDWIVSNDDEAEACGILDYMLACDFPDYGATAGAPLLNRP